MFRSFRLAFLALAFATSSAALAQQPQTPPAPTPPERQALLIPGKQTLQQRVITRPGAHLVPTRGASGGQDLPPFSVFYVYGRERDGNAEWLEVGRSSRGQPNGWVRGDEAFDWNQNMTLAFTPRSGRERVMFVETRDNLVELLSGAPGAARARLLLQDAVAGRGRGGPVTALEPETFIDISRRFYLLPILRAEQAVMQSGDVRNLLEIASIPLPGDPQPTTAQTAEFPVGVAFVIDTTLSMDPYIDRVRQQIRRVIERIRGRPEGQRFRFALVGYRNSTRAAPGLEYVSRVYANFEDFRDPARFLRLIDQMRATNVDSTSFDEDALAGMRTAIDDLKWDDYGGRYIVMVTDAGTREPGDPESATGLGPAQIRQLAQARGIATYVLHLLTPSGARLNNHDHARAQYEDLTNWPGVGPLYFQVPGGAVDNFGQQVDDLTENLLRQVTAQAGAGRRPAQPQQPQAPRTRITEQTLLVGQAMRLAYLGRLQGTSAPPVFRAWTSDRDLTDPTRAALDVRVLVTRSQLSDLSEVLRAVLEQGRAQRLRPTEFFNQLRSAAANMTRNPARLRAADARNLGELLGEFLQDLPYRSQIMEIDQDTWLAMGGARQREVLDSIEARLRLYQEFEQQRDLWITLGSTVPGDAVFPMPLEALP